MIIPFSASKRRQKLRKQNLLMTELKTKERAYVDSPTPALLQEISAVRSTLDNLLTQDEETKLRFTRQRFYEHGNKPGKYLPEKERNHNLLRLFVMLRIIAYMITIS